MYIIFENDDEIDVRAITTFGINVKEHDNPIGFFGTGLKYALAILLRTGHEIVIQSGVDEYRFGTTPEEIRGKRFDIVTMQNGTGEPAPLGFTVDVGKTWEVWMAYRELFCNCRDERGRVYENDGPPAATAGITRVSIRGEGIIQAHLTRNEFVLEGEPLFKTNLCEFHPGEADGVFYRGLRVMRFADGMRSINTYNLLVPVDLTEDRTAKYPWMVESMIRNAVIGSSDPRFIRRVLQAEKGRPEHSFDFSECYKSPSDEFLRVVELLARDRITDINTSALSIYKDHARKQLTPDAAPLTGVRAIMLKRALEFSERLGFRIDYPIIVTEALGEGVLGLAEDGRIYLSSHCFLLGTKQVAATAIEEFVHLKHGFADCSRPFQDFLLNTVVTLGEEIQGEPL